MGTRHPFDEGDAPQDEPEREDWEDEDNPDPYARDEDDKDEPEVDSISDENPDYAQSEDESAEELTDKRPWVDPRVGQSAAPVGKSISSLDEALALIEASKVEFQYECDRKAHSAYVLARSPSAHGVGPELAAGIHIALSGAGVRVLRHGVRPGVARDGQHYHYFFRVEQLDGSLPSREEVRAAVRRHDPTVPPVAHLSSDSEQATPPLPEALDAIHAELRQALTRAADAERRALRMLHIQDRRLIGYRRRLDETELLVRDVLRVATQSRAGSTQLRALSANLRIVEDRLDERTREVEKSQSLAVEQQGRANNLHDELEWYRHDHGRLKQRLVALESRQRDGAATDDVNARNELVARLLPEVSFVGDSVAVLWNETDSAGWIRDLMLLVHDHKQLVKEIRQRGHIEKIVGNADYTEVRRSRSARDMSRLYYTDKLTTPGRRRLCTADHRWIMRLCIKSDNKHQRRDIESLP